MASPELEKLLSRFPESMMDAADPLATVVAIVFSAPLMTTSLGSTSTFHVLAPAGAAPRRRAASPSRKTKRVMA